MAGPQYVYVMKGLSKTYPGGKQVLKDIWLSFYPGAKIGIVGVNGAGKSTLMRIMAGQDKEFTGEAWAADESAPGICRRSHAQIGARRARQCDARRRGKAGSRGSFQRDRRKLFRTTPQTRWRGCRTIEDPGLWVLDSQMDQAMDALRCPDGTRRQQAVRRRTAPRGAVCRLLLDAPDILLLDEPTNHLAAAARCSAASIARAWPSRSPASSAQRASAPSAAPASSIGSPSRSPAAPVAGSFHSSPGRPLTPPHSSGYKTTQTQANDKKGSSRSLGGTSSWWSQRCSRSSSSGVPRSPSHCVACRVAAAVLLAAAAR